MPSNIGTERRSHLRKVSLNSIEFCLDQHTPGETHLGATVNVSDSGMCVVASYLLKEGESITIKNDLRLPSQRATVRWVKIFQQTLFCKAGLMFTG